MSNEYTVINEYNLIAETSRYYLFNKGNELAVRNLRLVDRRKGTYTMEYLFNEVRSWDRLYYSPRMEQSHRDSLPKVITRAIADVIEKETVARQTKIFMVELVS